MKYASIIILIALAISACEFEPESEYFVDLSTETFENISVELSNTNDTVIVLTPTDFSFKTLFNEGQKVYDIKVYLGNRVILNNNDAREFKINPIHWETGTYPLIIEITTSTGTNSLADVAGAEALIYTVEWTIIIDNSFPESLEISNISATEGSLKIEWERSDVYNIKSYQVFRNRYLPEEDRYKNDLLTTINNADRTYYFDNSYAGGEVSYYINNISVRDEIQEGPESTFEAPFPQINHFINDGSDSVIFKWNKCLFANNFTKYEILMRKGTQPHFLSSIVYDNIDDTSDYKILDFGSQVELKLKTFTNDSYTEFISDTTIIYAGEKMPKFLYLIHPNNPDFAYLIYHNTITRYSTTENKVIASIETPFSNDYENGIKNTRISTNGQYLVQVEGTKIILYDPISLVVNKTIDVDYILSDSESNLKSISNNGLISFELITRFYGNKGVVFNIENEEPIIIEDQISHELSPSGKYYITKDSRLDYYNFYELNNKTPNKLGTVDKGGLIFDERNEEQFYIRDYNSIKTYSCRTLNLIDSYEHNLNMNYVKIDPISGNYLVKRYPSYEPHIAHIIDPQTKTIIESKYIISHARTWNQYSFFNNTLYSMNGFRLKLN
jgi:hypothetical protein